MKTSSYAMSLAIAVMKLDVGAKAQDPGRKVSRRPDAFHVVALQVIRDRRGAAVAAGEHPRVRACRRQEDRGRAIECGRLDESSRPGKSPRRIASKYDAALAYGQPGTCCGAIVCGGAKAWRS